jgi:hypothetical protein
VQAMIHLLLALNFAALILETRGIDGKVKHRKSKGRDTRISQPFKH